MAFRHAQPQHEILLRHRGDRLARQDHGAGRHRHLQHAAGGRRQHLAFGDLLLDDRAFGGARLQRVGCDVEGGARLIERRLRNGAAREQILGASEIVLRLGDLRLQPGNLRIERLHLQRELLVADGRDDLTLLDAVAFLDGKLDHRAADARARRHDVGAFDGGKDRLFVGHRFRRDGEGLLRNRRLRQQRKHGHHGKSGTHYYFTSVVSFSVHRAARTPCGH